MRGNRKYLVAVALLAVLAVVFGLAGAAAPMSQSVSPQQSSSSDSMTHFMNPPTYDSDWVNITDKLGQSFTLTHDLNTRDVLVDVVGRQSLNGGDHNLFFSSTIHVQGWNRTYGGEYIETAYCVVQTSDGGYAIAGYKETPGPGGSRDSWLVKTDSTGNHLWNKTYGGTEPDEAYSVVQTSDGGYALAGYTESYDADAKDLWLVKTDSAGNALWNKTHGGASEDYGRSVVQTSDGGYALAGYTNSYAMPYYDFWLVKTNPDGNMQWNQTYGRTDEDLAYSLVQTFEGGYIIVGRSYDHVGWLVKTDSDGNAEWNQTYGQIENPHSVVQTSDGGYVLGGYTHTFAGGMDFCLIKINSAGDMLWSKTYGGTEPDEAHSMVQTSDGGYALAGYTYSFGAGSDDFWLVKTDSDGNMQWNQTYGGADFDEAYCVVQTSDGGYAIAGYTQSFGLTRPDSWLIKTDVELGFSTGLSMTELTNSTITFYRGSADPYWNYIRVRIWTIKEPTWQFGDINQDGLVDIKDLAIVGKNYGKTFSLLSLTGIIAIASVHTYKKRKQPK